MTILWLITGASLVLALVALSQARRTAKRLEQMSQMYWELKYQYGELRVHVQRAVGDVPAPVTPATPAARPNDSFIPLTSLKR